MENSLFEFIIPSEDFLPRLSKHPATAFLLGVIMVASFLYGLFSIQDRALLFATGSFHPIFLPLWTTKMSDALGLISEPHSWFYVPNLFLQIIGLAIRLAVVNTIVVSSGELLMIVAAFRFFVMPAEANMGTRSCVKLLVSAYIMRVLWLLSLILIQVLWYRVDTSSSTWLGIVETIMTLRPGPSWLCVMFYFWNEILLRVYSWSSVEPLVCTIEGNSLRDNEVHYSNRESAQREGGEPIQQIDDRAEEPQERIVYPSSFRLFNKIPLGPETLRAVVVVHLLLRIPWGEIVLALFMSLFGSVWIYRRSGVL
ncbi:unnamed protein product [Phytomonas sp. Hart1]|nr:unnamed protein product [Phytomonas sp. Hart1]|eukprot:CCW68040.1 unnamed protein product [Phytomonas sp. isolate Hart1]